MRSGRVSAFTAAVLLLATQRAGAAVDPGLLFTDDFESGRLLTSDTPAGKWQSQQAQANVTLQAVAGAARRGGFGFRVNDARLSSGAGPEGALRAPVNAPTAAYARFWIRIQQSPANSFGFLFLAITNASDTWLTEGVYESDTITLMGGRDRFGMGPTDSFSYSLGDGSWHLMELFQTGLGTASGLRSMRIDRVFRAQRSADLGGESVQFVRLGQAYTINASFRGNVDFDDFRVSNVPPASHFTLSAPATVTSGQCVAFTLELRDSVLSALAGAPYLFNAGLSSGQAQFFSDAACTDPIVAITFNLAAEQVSGFFRVMAPGSATLQASYPDFFPANQVVSVQAASGPDGGQDAGSSEDGGSQQDAGTSADSGSDAGTDPTDAGFDAGSPSGPGVDGGTPNDIQTRGPWNLIVGCSTGFGPPSVLVALLLILSRRQRRNR